MDTITNAGALLRIYRLRKNWSLETLCQGICTASYLSKIEQGKVQPNRALLEDLFSKMGVSWQKITPEEGRELCDRLYALVFADDEEGFGSVRMTYFGIRNRPQWERVFLITLC